MSVSRFAGFSRVSLSLCVFSCVSLWSTIRVFVLTWPCFFILSLFSKCWTTIISYTSLWSCMDVPVAWVWASEWGMGERGEGSKLWPPFSVTRETLLVSHRSGIWKALTQCCLLFVHQVPLAEGNTVSFLEPGVSLEYIPESSKGFICLTLWWIIALELRMPFGSAYFSPSGHPVSSC